MYQLFYQDGVGIMMLQSKIVSKLSNITGSITRLRRRIPYLAIGLLKK